MEKGSIKSIRRGQYWIPEFYDRHIENLQRDKEQLKKEKEMFEFLQKIYYEKIVEREKEKLELDEIRQLYEELTIRKVLSGEIKTTPYRRKRL